MVCSNQPGEDGRGHAEGVPNVTSKGAHSDHYEGTFWGIVNRNGQIWTPQVFGTKAEAEQYREDAAKRLGVNFNRIPFTHKVVPVEFRIEPAQVDENPKGGDAKQAWSARMKARPSPTLTEEQSQ